MESVLLTIQELQKSKEFLRNEKNWWNGKGYANGRHCAVSIIGLNYPPGCKINTPPYNAIEALSKTSKLMGYFNAPALNDTMGHASVMVLYDLTIQFLQDGVIK